MPPRAIPPILSPSTAARPMANDTPPTALTGPEGVRALYFGSRLETTFERGSRYQYVGPDGNKIRKPIAAEDAGDTEACRGRTSMTHSVSSASTAV